MRPVLIGDLTAMARALMQVPRPERAQRCQLWLMQVEAADKFRKRHARCHPDWGNGSLMSRATAQAGPQVLGGACLESGAFCHCLQTVLAQLGMWRRVKAGRGG